MRISRWSIERFYPHQIRWLSWVKHPKGPQDHKQVHQLVAHIVLLSGPVASGKSTLCRALEERLGAKVVRTRELLARNLSRAGGPGRKDLQSEGERLDQLTGGVWLCEELQFVLNQDGAETTVVVDAVRTLDQARFIREIYGHDVAHIHLTAPVETLSKRYATRSSHDGQPELSTYVEVRRNDTERAIDNLQADADIIVDTGSSNEDGTFGVVRDFFLQFWRDSGFL